MTNYKFLPSAFEGTRPKKNLTFKGLFKLVAKCFHIPLYDAQCSTDQELPVRYNATTQKIERYDPETNTFINAVVV